MPDPNEPSDESIETLAGGTNPTSGTAGKTAAPSIVHGRSALATDSERYTVGEEIARGGMGAVIEATETGLERTVAMKVMLSPDASANARARFVREATVLARLEHPNIVPIHELGTDEKGRLFYTMKKVAGPLQAVINDLKRKDADTVREWSLDHLLSAFRKICDAIAFAHSRGIVHRDLKPENVMLGAFGEVLVMDWGLAKLMNEDDPEPDLPAGIEDNAAAVSASSSSLTLAGAVMGSPQYMPPEQAKGDGDRIDGQSDVFSLGGILYAILTLHPPVPGGSVSEVLEMVKSGGITPPSDLWSSSASRAGKAEPDAPGSGSETLPHCPGGRVPRALSAVTMQAMSFAKSERYAGVAELATEVARFQSGYATSAEHASAIGQLWMLVRRHRGVAATAAILLTAIGYLWLDFTIDLRAEKENALAEADNADIARTAAVKEAENARTAEAAAESARQQAERSLAVAKVTIADRARERRDWSEALRELETVPPEFRDTRWQRVRRGSDNSISPPIPLPDHVRNVIPHPLLAGAYIYNSGDFGLLDVFTGERKMLFERDRIGFVAASPDGRYLALLSELPGKTEVVELQTGRSLWSEKRTKSYHRAVFDESGKRLLLVGPSRIRAVDWQRGKTVWATRGIFGFKVLNRPGQPLVAAGEKIRVIDPATGKQTIVFSQPTVARKAAHNPRRPQLVCVDNDGILRSFDLQNAKQTFEIEATTGKHFDLEFLPDGRYFLLGVTPNGNQRSYSIEVRSAETGRLIQVLAGGRASVRQLAVHPLSGHVLGDAAVRLWRPELSRPLLAHPAATRRLGPYASGANTWGFIDDQRLIYLDPESETPIWTGIDGSSNGVDPYPAMDDFNTDTFLDLNRNRSALIVAHDAVAPAQDQVILASREDGKYRRVSRSEVPPIGSGLDTMRLSPKGDKIVWSNYSRAPVLDARKGLPVYNLRKSRDVFRVLAAEWLNEGAELLGLVATDKSIGQLGSRNRIMIWDGQTGEPRREVEHPTPTHLLALSPDDALFAEAGSDMIVRVRGVDDLKTRLEIHGHDAPISALAWHPRSNVVASASSDLAIRLWDAKSGARLAEIRECSATPVGLQFSPSGHLIGALTAAPENLLRIWPNPLSKQPIHQPTATNTPPAIPASTARITTFTFTNQLELVTPAFLHIREKRTQLTTAMNTWDFIDEETIIYSSPNAGAVVVNVPSGRTNQLPALQDLRGPVLLDLLPDRSAGLFMSGHEQSEQRTWLRLEARDGSWAPTLQGAFGNTDQPTDRFRLAPDAEDYFFAYYFLARIIGIESGKSRFNLRPKLFPYVFRIYDAAWIDEGKRLLALGFTDRPTGHPDSKHRIFLWDAQSGRRLRMVVHNSRLHVLSVAPTGDRFAEAGGDGKIRIRSTKSLEIINEIAAHADAIEGLDWHPSEDIIASVSRDRHLRFSDPTKGMVIAELPGFPAEPISVRFSPGGKRLGVVTREPEKLLRVWRTPEAAGNRR